MIKKILNHDNNDGLILFSKEEVKKYGLSAGKKVRLDFTGKANDGKPAQLTITILD